MEMKTEPHVAVPVTHDDLDADGDAGGWVSVADGDMWISVPVALLDRWYAYDEPEMEHEVIVSTTP